ncbi:MAG TPA: long-chain fatty acid--CoA ligase [Kofleriaceae bacterium]
MNATSLVELAEQSIRRFASNRLFGTRRDGAWSWLSYRDFSAIVDELRAGLAVLGVRAGDRVAIVSRNSVEWAAAAYATYGLGATFVPMYEAQLPRDWEFIVRDCDASVVFVRTQAMVDTLVEMQPRLPGLRTIVAIDGDGPRTLAELREMGRAQPITAIRPNPDDTAGLIYTSGTTGQPKGVVLTHHNITSNVIAATAVFPITGDDRTVSFLPWAHVYGQVVELHILMSVGASTAFNDDIDRLLEDLVEVKPTILVAVPRIFNKIHAGVRAQIAARAGWIQRLFANGLAASIRARRGEVLELRARLARWFADRLVFRKIRARFGGRLRYAISASAMLSPAVGEFVDALGIEVYEGYGLSETSPVVSSNVPGARRLGSVGRAIPGVRIWIDESRGMMPGQGEIVVYGPNVMKGYHARPDENARAFTADGGLRTGDLGHVDPAGYVFITGRLKEQYKLENGKYVMPTPLEEQLQLSPYITSVMLHGQDRPYNVALVVLAVAEVRAWLADHGLPGGAPAQRPEVHELIAHELERLSRDFRGYERVREFVMIEEPFTAENGLLTPTLKLKRREALARYGEALEALYGPGILHAPSHAPVTNAHAV